MAMLETDSLAASTAYRTSSIQVVGFLDITTFTVVLVYFFDTRLDIKTLLILELCLSADGLQLVYQVRLLRCPDLC